jgi:hypothetical protein
VEDYFLAVSDEGNNFGVFFNELLFEELTFLLVI